MAEQVSISREITASPDQVWAMVSDITRMGEWSPENDGGKWLRNATGPQPGSTFQGSNSNGKRSWKTVAKVVDAEPGRIFSFRVKAAGLKISEWRYEFEPTTAGCRVTETWIDQRGPIAKALGGPVSGVADRASHNRAGMEQTLDHLKAAAESAAVGNSD